MKSLVQKILKVRFEILTIENQKFPSHLFGYVFLIANILGVYFEWVRSCEPLFYLDLAMVFCGIFMIYFSRKNSSFRERYLYILFFCIGVFLEFETMAHDPNGDFDDPRVGYANTLILILTCIAFPEKPVIFRSLWISFYFYFYIRFSVIELGSFSNSRFWVMGTYYIPTIVFGSIFNQHWFRLKLQTIRQNHIILLLQKKLIEKERKDVVQDMHDFLGSGLTDLVQISNSLKPGQVLDISLINNFKRTLVATISKLRSRLQNQEEEKLLKDDFLLGFKMILNRRYEISKRKIKFIIPEKIRDEIEKISNETRRVLLPLLTEIVTNDLKYGEGDSIWELNLESKNFSMKLSTQTVFQNAGSYGLGGRTIRRRLGQIEGWIEENQSENQYQLLTTIPL